MIANYKSWIPILTVVLIVCYRFTQSEIDDFPGPFSHGIEADFLTLKTTISQAEAQNLVVDNRLGSKAVSFGFMNKYWIRFKEELRYDDELWYYSEPSSKGICVVRNKKAVRCMTTLII